MPIMPRTPNLGEPARKRGNAMRLFTACKAPFLGLILLSPLSAQPRPTAAGSPHRNETRTIVTTADSIPSLGDMKVLRPGQGYVVLANRLLWTANNGKTWSDITPQTSAMDNLDGALFLNSSTGWIVLSRPDASVDRTVVTIGFTSDRGQNWQFTNPSLPVSLAANYSRRAQTVFRGPCAWLGASPVRVECQLQPGRVADNERRRPVLARAT